MRTWLAIFLMGIFLAGAFMAFGLPTPGPGASAIDPQEFARLKQRVTKLEQVCGLDQPHLLVVPDWDKRSRQDAKTPRK